MANLKILVVEDDPLVLEASAEGLRDVGLEVVEAESADAALVLLEKGLDEVAVIFSDIETPGDLDGVALAGIVREQWPAITVVLTSGSAGPRAKVPSADIHFMAKPYDLARVAALITSLAAAGPLHSTP